MSKCARNYSIPTPPPSGRPPTLRWGGGEVQTSADELVAFHHLFRSVFRRREQREWSALYLAGQLSNLGRKTLKPIVIAFFGANPNAMRGLQRFISQETWPATGLIRLLQERVAEWLGDPDGVVIVDGSGFPKQGSHTVGVAPQYCGAVGKVTNCQEGVFAVYASRHGYAFLDERLYVHESWFSDELRPRWAECGIPEDLVFHTEPELALDMLQTLVTRGQVPFRWVTSDAHFGEIPAFLDGVDDLDKWYLSEVPSDTRVWEHTPAVEPPGRGVLGRPRTKPRVSRKAPRPRELRELAAQLPKTAWSRHLIKEGSKGPLIADFAFLRVTAIRDGLPGPRVWAIFRRQRGKEPDLKFYLSNAPASCSRRTFIVLSGLRWPIETALEEGKGEAGMDQYETRSWVSWHHQMAHAFLAHLGLVHLCRVFKKKSCDDDSPSPAVDCTRAGRRARRSSRYSIHHHLSAEAQLCSLPLASPTPPAKRVIFTWASTDAEVS
jgi:SRSO17 transposase